MCDVYSCKTLAAVERVLGNDTFRFSENFTSRLLENDAFMLLENGTFKFSENYRAEFMSLQGLVEYVINIARVSFSQDTADYLLIQIYTDLIGY